MFVEKDKPNIFRLFVGAKRRRRMVFKEDSWGAERAGHSDHLRPAQTKGARANFLSRLGARYF